MTAMRRRFDPLMDPCIDDDEMMWQHYEQHHFSKEPKTVFTLSFNTTKKRWGLVFFTQRSLLLHPI